MQIIITCGGGGTRLWPLSTDQKPKQFISIIDEKSLLEMTYERLRLDFEASQIWVATLPKYAGIVADLLPKEFDREHILVEPSKRDTFPAFVAHAAVIAAKTSTDEPLLFIQSDHILGDLNSKLKFNQALKKVAKKLRDPDCEFDLVALAVKPLYASTQYGYFELQTKDFDSVYDKIVEISSFKEKPDLEIATEFLKSERYLWNVSPSCFTYNSLLKNIKIHWPEVVFTLEKFCSEQIIITEYFDKLPKISFDYALVEKIDKVGVIGMDIAWEDLGNWDVVKKYLPEIKLDQPQIEIDGTNNAVHLKDKNRKVAFVGVSNLILVESEEGILILDPKFSSQTKKVAEYFQGLK
jgi:mannose-1-phosphate guanylyltransferase